MEKTQLLESLTALTSKYEQHRNYIEKAKIQAATGKFNPAVIEKVILDHEIKSSSIADDVGPLLPELRGLLTGYEATKAEIEASKGTVDEQVQELELRAAIGELTEDEFDQQAGDLRASQANVNERIAAVQADWNALDGALNRWIALAEPAGHYAAPAAVEAPPEEEAPAAVEAEPEPAEEPVVAEADEPVAEEEASSGTFGSRTEFREDLSGLFPSERAAGPPVASVRVAAVEEEIAIETSEVSEEAGDAPSADVPFGFEEDILGGDVGAAAVSTDVEIDLSGETPAPASDSAPLTSPDGNDAPRRALLLYQEGTAEEQIYPFTGDTLTIGRGRENDIQIKNDSKVSRYHCKLFRRGNNFYIEDQKSSNGSLVNGELITDRRLFGGEEIIIGETFFRFRIME